MDKDVADKLRGLVRRCTIKNVKDDGETQICSVEVAEGIWRDDVEITQAFGFNSVAPEDGGLAIVLAVGGDEGDLVVLPIGNPSKRMGGLQGGETGMHNEGGDKIVLGKGGDLKVRSAATISLKTANGHLE